MTIDNDTLLLLSAYHDGELSPGETLAMERRMEQEPELAAFARQIKSLSSRLVDVLPGEPAPVSLRGAILASISVDRAGGDTATLDDSLDEITSRSGGIPTADRWRSIAAALLVGVMIGGLGGNYAMHVTQDDRQITLAENEIVTAHLRALIAPQPFDVASSDNHVVKPWFNGKTTIAPTAPNLAIQGFPLVGGRVDLIGGKPVPVMVFKRRQHTISVTVTTSLEGDVGASDVFAGTNIRRWTHGGLTYWAVSDLNPGELSVFIELYRSKLADSG